jgi:hypothetical protein
MNFAARLQVATLIIVLTLLEPAIAMLKDPAVALKHLCTHPWLFSETSGCLYCKFTPFVRKLIFLGDLQGNLEVSYAKKKPCHDHPAAAIIVILQLEISTYNWSVWSLHDDGMHLVDDTF